MSIEKIFLDISSLLTLISFLTFIGIIWWAFSERRTEAFDEAANLPFADEEIEFDVNATETLHG